MGGRGPYLRAGDAARQSPCKSQPKAGAAVVVPSRPRPAPAGLENRFDLSGGEPGAAVDDRHARLVATAAHDQTNAVAAVTVAVLDERTQRALKDSAAPVIAP